MDFSTMQKKVDQHQYLTLDDFEMDFDRVWRNAMTYNDPSTVYYRAAVRMKLEGAKALKQVFMYLSIHMYVLTYARTCICTYVCRE